MLKPALNSNRITETDLSGEIRKFFILRNFLCLMAEFALLKITYLVLLCYNMPYTFESGIG